MRRVNKIFPCCICFILFINFLNSKKHKIILCFCQMCLLDAFMIGIENSVIDSAKRTIVFYQFSSRQYYEFGKGLFGFQAAFEL